MGVRCWKQVRVKLLQAFSLVLQSLIHQTLKNLHVLILIGRTSRCAALLWSLLRGPWATVYSDRRLLTKTFWRRARLIGQIELISTATSPFLGCVHFIKCAIKPLVALRFAVVVAHMRSSPCVLQPPPFVFFSRFGVSLLIAWASTGSLSSIFTPSVAAFLLALTSLEVLKLLWAFNPPDLYWT